MIVSTISTQTPHKYVLHRRSQSRERNGAEPGRADGGSLQEAYNNPYSDRDIGDGGIANIQDQEEEPVRYAVDDGKAND